MTLRSEDLVNSLKYMFKLRSGEGYVDDIDHLGNRRLRTIDELASEELRKGFLKLQRTVQERMSLKDPNELGASPSWSTQEHQQRDRLLLRPRRAVAGRRSDEPAVAAHARAALFGPRPGGLNRKRAGFEVRDVHISHYGRICPIETPEGTNIGLIASLAIYADLDEYGFLITPYRGRQDGKVNGESKYLRADEEMKAILAPPDAVDKDATSRRARAGRVEGDLATVRARKFSTSTSARGRPFGLGGADPVPRARRRQPRADGLEHAAAGRPAASRSIRRSSHRHGEGRSRRTAAWSSAPSARQSSRTSIACASSSTTPTSTSCASSSASTSAPA
jgi:hypothetical protein